MGKMTKTQIQERQLAIWEEMDKLEKQSREANGGEIKFTEEEAAKYDALVRESSGLSARAKAMASDDELKHMRSNEDKAKKLREMLKECAEKRENATTILNNPVTSGADQNTTGNMEAGGLIPLKINEIIDTKVEGLELPGDLKMQMGVVGNEIWPFSTDDVKFTINGEVQKVSEQGLNFANIQATLQRIAASVAVSHRAIDNAAFDIVGFINYKMQKGWAIFKALFVYAHGSFTKLQGPFAGMTAKELTLDENIGENLAIEAAELYDLGFEGIPTFIMDKVVETKLKFKKLIPGQTGDRTVVQDGQVVGYPLVISKYIDYTIDANGDPTRETEGEGDNKKNVRFIGIGHWAYLAMQQHGEFRFNIDGVSSANFDRGTVVVGVSTDFSLTELSSKVNGNTSGKPQAFKLIKLVEPASSSEI